MQRSRLFFLSLLAATVSVYGAEPSIHWDHLFPSGARQGSTRTLTVVGGKFESWPVETWTDGPDISLRPVEGKEGQLEIDVRPDARPGVRWLRLYDANGPTSPRPFVVGTLPEIEEQEPNDSNGTAQKVSVSAVVVNGRLEKKGDVDAFAVHLERGQTLVAALVAHEILRSPMDAILQVSSSDGHILEQNDDDPDMDPRIVFTAPSSNTFVVRCFTFPERPSWIVGFDGDEKYVYRLTLTTQGFIDHPHPPVWNRSQPGGIAAVGWNISEDASRLQLTQLEPLESLEPLDGVELFHPDLGNTALVRLVSSVVFAESSAADQSQDGVPKQPLEPPCWIGGVLAEPAETDAYEFNLKEGPVVFQVEARKTGSALDASLVLYDPDGKEIERADDADGPDTVLGYAIKTTGSYRLEIFDLHRRGGPRYFYALRAHAEEPDFELSLADTPLTIPAGGSAEIPVEVKRLYGLEGSVEITATGLPPGVTCAKTVSEGKGDSAGKVTLKLTAASEALRSGPFRVVGTATVPRALTRSVRSKSRWLLPPVPHLWLTVQTPPPESTDE